MGTIVTRLRGMPDNPAQGMTGGSTVAQKHDMSDNAVMRILDAFRATKSEMTGSPPMMTQTPETDAEVFDRLSREWVARLEREAREVRRRAAAEAIQADTVTSAPDV